MAAASKGQKGAYSTKLSKVRRTAKKPTANDVVIANYALTLEYLEAAFYAAAVDANYADPDINAAAKILAEHEAAHVKALKKVLGKAAVKAPKLNMDAVAAALKDQETFITTAAAIEPVGTAAYAGAGPYLSNVDVTAAALAIHSVEANHAAYTQSIVVAKGLNTDSPVPNAFNPAFTFRKTVKTVSGLKFVERPPPAVDDVRGRGLDGARRCGGGPRHGPRRRHRLHAARRSRVERGERVTWRFREQYVTHNVHSVGKRRFKSSRDLKVGDRFAVTFRRRGPLPLRLHPAPRHEGPGRRQAGGSPSRARTGSAATARRRGTGSARARRPRSPPPGSPPPCRAPGDSRRPAPATPRCGRAPARPGAPRRVRDDVLVEAQLAPRPQHAPGLGQRGRLVGHGAQDEREDDRVRLAVGQRQRLRHALGHLDAVPSAASRAAASSVASGSTATTRVTAAG